MCQTKPLDQLCQACKLLLDTQKTDLNSHSVKKKAKKHRKPFNKLFDDISFALSGYVNPHRDEIRSKALKMGAKFIANPDTANNKCTHLICAFKNTPKSQQLKGHCKIVGHKFIEDCFDKKKRLSNILFLIIFIINHFYFLILVYICILESLGGNML